MAESETSAQLAVWQAFGPEVEAADKRPGDTYEEHHRRERAKAAARNDRLRAAWHWLAECWYKLDAFLYRASHGQRTLG